MTKQLDLIPRADYENAEEQMMRPEVLKQPLLPIYEAIHNAIHASQEQGGDNIGIGVELHRENSFPVGDVARIEGFTVTDSGIGFTDEKTEAFFRLFTKNKKKLFNCKGIGRLAYFSSFINVDVDSVYKVGDSFMERIFSVTISSIGTDKLPEAVPASRTENKTVIKVHGLKADCFDRYSLPSETIVNNLRDYFAAAVLSLDSLILSVADGDKSETIDKNSYMSTKGKDITIGVTAFRLFRVFRG